MIDLSWMAELFYLTVIGDVEKIFCSLFKDLKQFYLETFGAE